MQLNITARYIIAFIALNFIMGELHEQAHINTGFFICGCYGPRDFNFWSTCQQCLNPAWAWWATLTGPLFSCCMMWLGAIWFSTSKNNNKRMLGFSLLFANLPFARIFTALVGGGDEKVVIQALLGDNSNSLSSKLIAAALVTAICLPPIIMTGRRIINKNRWIIVTGFAVLPLVYGMLYQRLFLNSLLKNNILSEVHFLGTPDLIVIHFVFLLLALFICRKGLLQLKRSQAGSM